MPGPSQSLDLLAGTVSRTLRLQLSRCVDFSSASEHLSVLDFTSWHHSGQLLIHSSPLLGPEVICVTWTTLKTLIEWLFENYIISAKKIIASTKLPKQQSHTQRPTVMSYIYRFSSALYLQLGSKILVRSSCGFHGNSGDVIVRSCWILERWRNLHHQQEVRHQQPEQLQYKTALTIICRLLDLHAIQWAVNMNSGGKIHRL